VAQKQARDHQGPEYAPEYYVGLISGTSVDGIDAVVIESNGNHSRLSAQSSELTLDNKPNIIATKCFQIPSSLQKQIHALCHDDSLTPDSLNQTTGPVAETHQALGLLLASGAKEIIAQAGIRNADVIAIGSHGQTIKHQPPTDKAQGYSLQIGCAKTIAAETGITTISDFRNADMRNGGQGAPLAPAFHQLIAPKDLRCCVFLNLGGIANISVVDQQQALLGYDTGPANTLMDAWIQHCKQQAFDRSGEWARSGKVNESLLNLCLEEAYFQIAAPKSTGRELFNLKWLEKRLQRLDTRPVDADVQATLLFLSALTISNEIDKLSARPQAVYCCGGGSHNTALTNQLQMLMPDIVIDTTNTLGIHVDYVEAALFAWLAKKHIHGESVDLQAVTGASQPTLLGEREHARA